MIIFSLISTIQLSYTILESSNVSSAYSLLTCDNLEVYFDSNITFLCEDQFNLSSSYEDLPDFRIKVKININFINNSFRYDKIYYSRVKGIVNITTGAKFTFTDFLDFQIIQNFLIIFQSKYNDAILTMEWSRYISCGSNYCQWDYSTILPKYNGIMKQFEKFGESTEWEKVCLNNQACFHYVADPPGKIVIIPMKTTIIFISAVCGFILLYIILLYFVARCNILKRKSEISNEDSSFSDDSSYTDTKVSFTSAFFKELIGIGHSAGSLVMEGIGLLRSFQRICATKTFELHFSKDCYKMISWAKNLFEIIISNFYIRSFNDIELFYCYNYVFPIVIITFITLLILTNRFYYLLLINAVFAAMGFGFGYIKYNYKTALCFIIPAFVISIIVIVSFCCCRLDKKFFKYVHSTRFIFPFTFAVINSLIIASIVLLPFFMNNLYFVGSCLFISLIIIVVVFVIEIVIGCLCNFTNMADYFMFKFPILVSNILTLLYIPVIDYFVNIMKNEYKKDWTCIIGFVNFGFLLPLLMIVLMMFGTDTLGKYRKRKLIFYEIIDMFRQISFAFVSAFDIPYACIGIEAGWLLLMIFHHPYNNVSEIVLQIGNSLIIILSNIIVVVFDKLMKGMLSFYMSICIIAAACIPAIISLFIFFKKDFEIDDDDQNEEKAKNLNAIISVLITFYSPISWLFFGMVIPVIMKYFNDYYDHYHIM